MADKLRWCAFCGGSFPASRWWKEEKLSNLEEFWAHLGEEARAKVESRGGNENKMAPPMCARCSRIAVEVDKVIGEIEVLKGVLEGKLERLRKIVREDLAVEVAKAKVVVEEIVVEVEPAVAEEVEDVKKEETSSEDGGGVEDEDYEPNATSGSSGGSDEEESEEVEEIIARKKPRLSISKKDPLSSGGGTSREKLRRPDATPEVFTRPRCELCHEKLKRDEVRKHLAAHIGDEYIVPCLSPKCQLLFISTSSVTRHLFKQKLCGNLVSTLGISVIDALFTCEVCGFIPAESTTTGGTHSEFRLHLKKHEEEIPEKKVPCPVAGCSKKFALKQSVQQHLIVHRGQLRKSCHLCSEVVEVASRLEHYKRSHPEADVFPCGVCGKLFFERGEWLRHHGLNHKKSPISCDLCEISLSDTLKFREHLFEVHGIGQQFLCEHCPAAFYVKQSLLVHVRLSHEKRARPTNFGCGECDAKFFSKVALATHRVKKHGDPGEFVCDECGKVATSANFLKRHVSEVHRGIKFRKPNVKKERTCHECGATFKQPQSLESHILRVHPKEPGVKPFVCEVEGCGKDFYDHRSHLMHQRTHSKVRPVCDECGMTFATAHTLKIHSVVHTGERPHGCEICGQRFRQRVTLMTHLKSHEKKGERFKPGGEMRERTALRKTKVELEREAGKL